MEILNHLRSTEKLRLGLNLGSFAGTALTASGTEDLGMTEGLTEHFLVTGPASQALVLPPHGRATVSYALLPLACGHCRVPRLAGEYNTYLYVCLGEDIPLRAWKLGVSGSLQS